MVIVDESLIHGSSSLSWRANVAVETKRYEVRGRVLHSYDGLLRGVTCGNGPSMLLSCCAGFKCSVAEESAEGDGTRLGVYGETEEFEEVVILDSGVSGLLLVDSGLSSSAIRAVVAIAAVEICVAVGEFSPKDAVS